MENTLRLTKLDANFYLNLLNRVKDNKQFNIYKKDSNDDSSYAQDLINSISKPIYNKTGESYNSYASFSPVNTFPKCDSCNKKAYPLFKVLDVVDFQDTVLNVCSDCSKELIKGTYKEVL